VVAHLFQKFSAFNKTCSSHHIISDSFPIELMADSSPDIIRQIKSRRMRWEGHVARMGEGRNVYRVLVGKPEGERPRRKWDGIRMDLREIVWGEGGGVDSPGSG
jgi:hypothetical protein